MSEHDPPLCPEFYQARAVYFAAMRASASLLVATKNADTSTVAGLAGTALKLAKALERRAEARWKTVSLQYAPELSLLDDIPEAAAEGDELAEDCKGELERLQGDEH